MTKLAEQLYINIQCIDPRQYFHSSRDNMVAQMGQIMLFKYVYHMCGVSGVLHI